MRERHNLKLAKERNIRRPNTGQCNLTENKNQAPNLSPRKPKLLLAERNTPQASFYNSSKGHLNSTLP